LNKRVLEEPYRSRAVPPGSVRYWSWLFAAPESRPALLGIYALTAEWRALLDPATEAEVARIKLAWWRDELRRLAADSPLHPVTRYLAELPRIDTSAFAPLQGSLEAAAAQLAGVPLERSAELESHAAALYGLPLVIASRLGGASGIDDSLRECTTVLAAADYLARAVADYGREARAGRIVFVVEELLAAQIDNDDLAAASPPLRLQVYLQQLRDRAVSYFSTAAALLPPAERSSSRHLAVLAALGLKHVQGHASPASADFRLMDLYNAWSAARRAARAR
jgi:15-cis-phytoene synthase